MTQVLQSPVLVLNKYWTAFRVINAARAFCLLVKGVAEAIDIEDGQRYANYDFASWADLSAYKAEFDKHAHEWVQCVRGVLAVPEVIRLVKFGDFKRMKIRFNRRNIFARDGHICQYCGGAFASSELNLDHVLPRSRGGATTWENIVCSCIACNTRKGDRTHTEAGMTLVRKPKRPALPLSVSAVRHNSWKHFVDAAYWNVELVD